MNKESMEEPLVSAIITTHNRRTLLEKAVQSVYAQTYCNIELIVVDDASTDGSEDYIKSKYPNISYHYNQQQMGANYSRNLGMRNAKGEYLALLDDDDEWTPTKIAMQVCFLNENEDYGLVSCNRVLAWDNGKESAIPPESFPQSGDLSMAIWYTLDIVSSTLMFRNTSLERYGMFDEKLDYWQDYELLIRYSQQTKIGILLNPLVYYRFFCSDIHRKSNNLEAWEKSVRYIHEKHRDVLLRLPEDVRLRHEYIVAEDGLSRANACHNNKKKLEYLLKLLRIRWSFHIFKITVKTVLKIIFEINR